MLQWSAASLVFFIIAMSVQFMVPKTPVNKDFLRPPENIKYFTLGYNDMLTSVLWLRLLQNFEYCEGGAVTGADFVDPLDTEKDRLDGILKRKIKPSKCHLGWVYSMLNTISEIDPKFNLVYDPGGIFLSVTVDDREGARRIFEKGIAMYPDDWTLHFRAAYHYLWEMQDAERAAQLFAEAAKKGAPDWAIALSAALYTKAGQAKIAKVLLEDALKKNPSSQGLERIKTRLKEVDQILKENP